MTSVFWTWVAAFFTLSILSFLYKDNPFYKFAEHIYVGSSAAFYVLQLWVFDVYPKLVGGFQHKVGVEKWILIIPAFLSVLMLTRFIKPISWLSRWAIAFTVGMAAGLGVTGLLQGFLVPQVKATFLPFYVPSTSFWNTFYLSINNILIVLGTVATIFYFYFSREHKGTLGTISRAGITFIMIAFGASFGYTVMARVSLLIGRMYFLIHDWLHLA
ncbi:MAG TPA: hypothetical protein ENL43_00060 [candidate division WOR-3 bacterium]|uniref:Uncharacterized protein n=1 Tax=candidate division WOR-3 bacterium TaxID=2052148 RepID=A0A7V5HM23_UNCW3|nr:hypothetical protein [candidate division WOR-3 bacterium]